MHFVEPNYLCFQINEALSNTAFANTTLFKMDVLLMDFISRCLISFLWVVLGLGIVIIFT